MSWRCFFCDEEFTTRGAAAEHFGRASSLGYPEPGCYLKVKGGGERGLLAELRRTEDELARALEAVHDATLDAQQDMRNMQGRHSHALQRAEEAGYQRGLEDARKEEARS